MAKPTAEAADGRPASASPTDSSSSSPSMIRGASLLISLQLISRLLTFAANQLLLRYLTAPLLGLSAQLEVYYLSVLFFARESLRVAIQRQGPPASAAAGPGGRRDAARESQAVLNLGYLAIGLGSVVCTGLGWVYLASATEATLLAPYLVESLRLYGLAAMIELLSEPCFVLLQSRLQFGTRAVAESAATFVRCAAVFGSAVWASRSGHDIGVLPFALGQVCYGVVLVLVYLVSGYRLASSMGFSILPRAVVPRGDGDVDSSTGSYFYRPTISLAGSMMAQSLVKHLLTQGDTFLISLFSTPEIQGTYALANNYGGLLARLLFQPVEESSRSYFSRLLASTSRAPGKPSPEIREALQSFRTLVRVYLLLSMVVASVGPFAAHPLLAIVAGRRWMGSGAGHVLAAYCFYIPFLALNGVAESFVASVATEAEVHRQSGWMSLFSVIFATSAFLFMRIVPLGATGLVIANSINMFCRIVWSAYFITGFFRARGASAELPSLLPNATLFLSATTAAVMYQFNITENAEQEPLVALVKVASCAIPLLLSLYVKAPSSGTSSNISNPVVLTVAHTKCFHGARIAPQLPELGAQPKKTYQTVNAREYEHRKDIAADPQETKKK